MEEKIDKIVESIHKIDITLIKQEENLSEHMRRTKILEDKLDPIETHVSNVSFAFKAIKWIGLPLILTGLGILIKTYLG